jgi:hypothetical protein
MMSFVDTMTLGEARDELRGLVEDGHRCPLCTQFAKVYKFKLNASMAVAAIHIRRLGGRSDWVDVSSFPHRQQAHLSKLRFWGILERPEGEEREDGSSRVGLWRLTDQGEAWVLGRVSVPSHARIYNNRCLGLRGEPTSIRQALGREFDYRELMAA